MGRTARVLAISPGGKGGKAIAALCSGRKGLCQTVYISSYQRVSLSPWHPVGTPWAPSPFPPPPAVVIPPSPFRRTIPPISSPTRSSSQRDRVPLRLPDSILASHFHTSSSHPLHSIQFCTHMRRSRRTRRLPQGMPNGMQVALANRLPYPSGEGGGEALLPIAAEHSSLARGLAKAKRKGGGREGRACRYTSPSVVWRRGRGERRGRLCGGLCVRRSLFASRGERQEEGSICVRV